MQRFIEEGAKVIVVDINRESALKVAENINASGGSASAFVADVADEEATRAMIKHAVDTFGRLDILHNNATALEIGAVKDLSLEGWNKTLAVNVTAPFLATKHALPIMIEQGGGAIVNTASVSGTTEATMGCLPTTRAKAAVINFTRSAAIENARFGVRMNCVCPGAIDTPAMKGLTGGSQGPMPHVSVAGGELPKLSADVSQQVRERNDECPSHWSAWGCQ